jgi:ABC-type phosphate transport system permease subunit
VLIKDFELFFKYFQAIQDSTVENILFSSAPQILIGLFGLLVFTFFINFGY